MKRTIKQLTGLLPNYQLTFLFTNFSATGAYGRWESCGRRSIVPHAIFRLDLIDIADTAGSAGRPEFVRRNSLSFPEMHAKLARGRTETLD